VNTSLQGTLLVDEYCAMNLDSATRSMVAEPCARTVSLHGDVSRPGVVTRAQWIGLALVLLAAFGMWYYVARILIPAQHAAGTKFADSGGYFSDFCPYWYGSRGLLLHGRSPYMSPQLSLENQQCYLGRIVDPHSVTPDFAYPAYVVFVMAPMLAFNSFHTARIVFALILVLLTAASVVFWTRAFRLRVNSVTLATILAALMATFPVVQGMVLQQLTLLVAVLIAATAAAKSMVLPHNWCS
jgi:hypothetical protein